MIAFTPFDGSVEVANQMVKRLFDAGLMSFMAGGNPSRVRFLLPLGCIEESHIDSACQIIENVVAEYKRVVRQLGQKLEAAQSRIKSLESGGAF